MDKPTIPDETTEILSPSEVAARLRIKERYLRKFARDTGHCRIFGNRMVFTPDDVAALLEASKPTPKVTRFSTTNTPAVRRVAQKPHSEIDYIQEVRRLFAASKKSGSR